MERDDAKLRFAVADYIKSGEDFVGIHWISTFEERESLVAVQVQDRTKKKVLVRDSTNGHQHMVWPGMSEGKLIKLIKTYRKSHLYNPGFYCMYRTNRSPELKSAIEELIPEENREKVL